MRAIPRDELDDLLRAAMLTESGRWAAHVRVLPAASGGASADSPPADPPADPDADAEAGEREGPANPGATQL